MARAGHTAAAAGVLALALGAYARDPQAPSRGGAAVPGLPSFSWATTPTYWYSSNPEGALDDDTARYAASFPVAIPNGNHMRYAPPSGTGEEAKLLAVARQLKAINKSCAIYYYLNSMMDWSQTDLHVWIARNHPGWWAANERGETVCMDGQPLFNLSVAGMREKWVEAASTALASGLYSGVFADRANPLPTGDKPQPGPGQAAPNGVWMHAANGTSSTCLSPPDGLPPFRYSSAAYAGWAAGHAALLADAQAAASAASQGFAIIANNNATADVGGRQFERWCRNDFDKATIEQDIAELERAAAAGKVALVHGGEPCDADTLALSLSAFLVAAGPRSYFACTDGWGLQQGWVRSQRWPEFDYPLGAPLGLASRAHVVVVVPPPPPPPPQQQQQDRQSAAQASHRNGSVGRAGNGGGVGGTGANVTRYTRTFASGTAVALDLHDAGATASGTGCIFWANGKVTGDAQKCAARQRELRGHPPPHSPPPHSPPPPPPPLPSARCAKDADCSLNGRCVSGTCACDLAWSGEHCQRLAVMPTAKASGLRQIYRPGGSDGEAGRRAQARRRNGSGSGGAAGGLANLSTWGGAVLYDGDSESWVMFASEMTQSCGMGAWMSNSHIVVASSKDPLGLYQKQQAVVPVWSHEVDVVRGPQGEYVAFFSGRFPSNVPECKCHDGSTGSGCTTRSPRFGGGAVDTDPTFMSWSRSPYGPWSKPVVVSSAHPSIDTNAAPVILSNGSLVGLWRDHTGKALPLGHHSRPHVFTAADWKNASTYTWHTDNLFSTEDVPGALEDPFTWVDVNGNYHALFHMMYDCATCGGHAYSEDGLRWLFTGIAYNATVHFTDDGSVVEFPTCERPHLVFDEAGTRPIALTNGVTLGTDQSYTLLRPVRH